MSFNVSCVDAIGIYWMFGAWKAMMIIINNYHFINGTPEFLKCRKIFVEL